MGSPLGPTLANVFMCNIERTLLDECPLSYRPIFYRRFVDDTFVILRKEADVQPFLRYLNSIHDNLSFTHETEQNGVLPFLDVFVQREAIFRASVYRKPTFTGLYTNFTSFIPQLYKLNMAKTLFVRAYKICSDYLTMHREFRNIRCLLQRNGFPLSVVDRCLRTVLDHAIAKKPNCPTVERKELLLVLPFTGKQGLLVRSKLTRMCRRFFPMAKLRVVFTTSYQIKSLFRFKDRMPAAMRSSVVYDYSCPGCNSRYVGKTSRHLYTRIAEHRGISPRTQKELACPSFSSIREHALEKGHPIKLENFRVLCGARNVVDLDICECLHILNSRPDLNTLVGVQLALF